MVELIVEVLLLGFGPDILCLLVLRDLLELRLVLLYLLLQ